MTYIIKTEDTGFCGKGIAEVPFINGEGKTDSTWIATIAKELGYKVEEEPKVEEPAKVDKKAAK